MGIFILISNVLLWDLKMIILSLIVIINSLLSNVISHYDFCQMWYHIMTFATVGTTYAHA